MMVVGIAGSSGGLDAFTKFVTALPATSPMAFILVQHADPAQPSLLRELLQPHTAMPIHAAGDLAPLEPGTIYVIEPGTSLTVGDGRLHVSQSKQAHGARLPFDTLLLSMAAAYGDRTACVILSGTGADGSAGLRSIAESGGLVIAQDPAEAEYDGMPTSAIQTGGVDQVLLVADIPDALLRFEQRIIRLRAHHAASGAPHDWLPDIIELLRTETIHDFSLYKRGTLQRRVERRMAMAVIRADSMEQYLAVLKKDPAELALLTKNLLINVTSFFRDPKVFDYLVKNVLPELIQDHPVDQPLRIWVAGCSTGQETYSLAMVILEQVARVHSALRVQVFASDVDADAITAARDGLYPAAIETEVSAPRLARFFTKEPGGWRVSAELRACVVFAVQDVLADPPFSRMDLVSCRNLLIYLQPEAQAKVISMFHFALREGGILVLGNSEAVAASDDRFAVIAKAERLYRHIGRSRPGEFGFLVHGADGTRVKLSSPPGRPPLRQAAIAELSRRMVLDAHAPAAVMINGKHECLYTMGPTDRYLRMAPGYPTHDLLAMARPGLRTVLRSAVQRAQAEHIRILVPGGRAGGGGAAFDVEVQPVSSGGEDLLLICFVDRPEAPSIGDNAPPMPPRTIELEQELEATRAELLSAIRDLDISTEEQKAINEEALSVNEEYQSTNEELLTSKEELQSLNEELTALNSQLQETLERQRTTSDDLQNVLYSTDLATLFLDANLAIRFFTPATKTMFRLIPGDIGRPLTDLHSLSNDPALVADARLVLQRQIVPDREVDTADGATFVRRIRPYRSQATSAEGVVITFTDITERKRVRLALQDAMRRSELANAAKSRFLASASHDLRQPLQTLTLLRGLLAKIIDHDYARLTRGDRAQQLMGRFGDTLASMTGMLNTLLDINQIDAGVVHATMADVPIGGLLARLHDEFAFHAEVKHLTLRVVACSYIVRTDAVLLEQMLRNLLSNALKYTTTGKVLLGCRRAGANIRIEVWDTGIGIAADEMEAVFEEYHQIGNPARERSRGLGLGLSIVKRLAELIGHKVRVRSWQRRGSVFSIEVPRSSNATPPDDVAEGIAAPPATGRTGAILLIEDDPDVCTLLAEFLVGLGHHVVSASDGVAALELTAHGAIRPDIVLTDYNLPHLLNGRETGDKLRAMFGSALPVVILTGDISTETLADVAAAGYLQLNKPVQLAELAAMIQRFLPDTPAPGRVDGTVFIVDDDASVRDAIAAVLDQDGRHSESFDSCEAFLAAHHPAPGQCLLLDANLPGLSGLDLLRRLQADGRTLPSIIITGSGDVDMAVAAMKAGAADFIEKPVGGADLVASIVRALDLAHGSERRRAWERQASLQLATLTARQREVMTMVLDGHPSKNIAADLRISQRTVENHRAAIMHKTRSASLPALARLVMAAAELPRATTSNGTGAPLAVEPN